MIEFPNLKDLPKEVREAIIAKLKSMNDDEHFEPVATMPEDMQKEWQSFTDAMLRAETDISEAKGREAIWWARVEKLLGIYGRNLRYDADSGTVLMKKKEKVSNMPEDQ